MSSRKSAPSRLASIGDMVPNLSVQAVARGIVQELNLRAYQSSKSYLILLFVPVNGKSVEGLDQAAVLDELTALSEKLVLELHDSLRTYVVGVVDATIEEILRWMSRPIADGGLKELPYPVVSDPSGKFSSFFGVWDSTAWEMYRAHAIISDKGAVRQLTINEASVSRDVGELFRQVTAFRYTDEHGEVCPANWQSGDAAIEPDPAGSRKFFEKKFRD